MKIQTKEGLEALASKAPHWPEVLELEATLGVQRDTKRDLGRVWGWLFTRATDGTILTVAVGKPVEGEVTVGDQKRLARLALEEKVESYEVARK